MSICTPVCPICLKNYNKDVKPNILQPCGHGLCSTCIAKLEERDELIRCPTCRKIIETYTKNYDLRTICDDIETDPTFWGRKLMELVNLPGTEIFCIGKASSGCTIFMLNAHPIFFK